MLVEEYRFERGHNDYVEYHKLEVYEDGDDQNEAFSNKLAKQVANEADRTIAAGSGADTTAEVASSRLFAETLGYPEVQSNHESSAASAWELLRLRPSASQSGLFGRRAPSIVNVEDPLPLAPLAGGLRRRGASSNLSAAAASSVSAPLLPALDQSVGGSPSETATEIVQEDGQGLGLEGEGGHSSEPKNY